jgi:co-chaperonin GroES (HSP10)
MSTIQPLTNYLLCRLRDGNNTESGLHIPDSVSLSPYGEVLAIGPEVKTIVGGDKILFSPHAIVPVQPDPTDSRIFLIAEPSVFAKYV